MKLCKRGHDRDAVGVNANRDCLECVRIRNTAYRRTGKGRVADRRRRVRYLERLRAEDRERRLRRLDKLKVYRKKRYAMIKAKYGSPVNYFWAMQIRESL